MNSKKWYHIDAEFGHVGTGRGTPITLYIYARNVTQALNRYRYVPGIKDRLRIPSIRQLTDEESVKLEGEIKESGYDIRRAKHHGYVPNFEI